MIAILRHYRITHIVAFILAVGLYLVLHEYTAIKTWVRGYAVLGGYLIFIWAVNVYIRYKYTQINRFLNRDCYPEPYIAAYRYIIAQLNKGKKPIINSAFWVSLSSGLSAAGQYNVALDVLRKCKTFSQKRSGRITKIVYHNNLFCEYIALGQMGKAVEHLENMENMLCYLKARRKVKVRMERLYTQNECKLCMENGDYKNAEDVFSQMAGNARSNYERVIAHLWLGKVYAHTGQGNKARQAFEYVVGNGNNLYAVTLAKEELIDLECFRNSL